METSKKVQKVAIFCDFLSSLGGCEYYNVLLAKSLKNRGIEVKLYIGEKPVLNYWLHEIESCNIFYRTPNIFHDDLKKRDIEVRFIANCTEEINSWSPDIIHVHPFGKLTISWLENKFSNKSIPIVATEYTTPASNTSHWFVKEYLEYNSNVSAYIATCKAVKNGLKEYFNFKGKIVEIPHLISGCNIEKVKLDSSFSAAYVGRLSPEKGISSLILAWNFVIKKIPHAKLHIYGGGSAENYLKSLAKSLNMENSVFFEGVYLPFSGINEIAKKYFIFVQPSHFESIPTTLIELMLRQRIVIASDVGGIPELVKQRNGYIYKNGSAESLARKIIYVMLNKKKLEKIALNARSSIVEKYDLEKNIDKIIQLYEIVLNQTLLNK